MFEDEVIESFTLPDYPQYRIYRIGGMVFTGLLPMTGENLGRLPGGRGLFGGEVKSYGDVISYSDTNYMCKSINNDFCDNKCL